MMNFQELRKLISKGNTGDAMDALLKMVEEGEWRNRRIRDDLIILSSQYQEIKRKGDMGMISGEEYARDRVHIDGALLSLIAALESGKEPEAAKTAPAPPAPEKETARKVPWWVVLIALLLPAGGFGIWKAFFDAENAAPAIPTPQEQPEAATPPVSGAQSVTAAFDWTCQPAACTAPCEVAFANTSQNADRFQWDFGDGQLSNQREPTYKYLTARAYTVTLTAIRGDQVNTLSKTLEILPPARTTAPGPPPPVAMFEADKWEGAAPCEVTFTNRSQHADRYTWLVDGAQAGSGRNLAYTFSTPGAHSVKLLAARGGLKDAYTQSVRIVEKPKAAVALFRAERLRCTAPCEIAFYNLSQNADQYEWLVNGSAVGRGNNLVQTFRNAGTYELRLNARGPGGADSYARSVIIDKEAARLAPPKAQFVANPTGGRAPCKVAFTNTSDNADRFAWYVNNALVGNERSFEYTFRAEGQYTVKLVASNTGGRDEFAKIIQIEKALASFSAAFLPERRTCSELPCNIVFTNRSAGAERYEWYVNESLVSKSTHLNQSFTRTGAHKVKLVAYRGTESKTALETIQVSTSGAAEMKIAFRADKTSCSAPCSILFTNTSENAESFKWYVNNLAVGNARDLRHTFNSAGTYTVKLYGSKSGTSKFSQMNVTITTGGTPAIKKMPVKIKPNTTAPTTPKPGLVKKPQ